MAQFQGDIVLRTLAKFDPSFNKVINKIEQVSDLVNKLNKQPLNIFGKSGGPGGDIAAKQLKGFQDAVRNVANSGDDAAKRVKLLGNTVATTAEKAQVFAQALDNVRLKSGGLKGQEAAVKNLARAWGIATEQARTYSQRLDRIQNDTLREARGLQPQAQRDFEVARRLRIQKDLTREKQKQANLTNAALNAAAKQAQQTDRNLATIKRQTKEQERQLKARRESLLLGVGFPLLFGGGVGSVVGSAAGALGDTGGGFGGQIFGGAIGQSLDNFVQGIGELGQALNPVTADVEKIVSSAGLANTELGNAIKNLESTAGSAAALKEATRELERVVGQDGVAALSEFGDRFTRFGNQLAEFFTQVQVAIAKLLQETPTEKNLRTTGETIFQARRSDNTQIQDAVSRLDKASTPNERLAIQKEIVSLVEQEATARQRELELQAASTGEAALKLREIQATNAEKQIELDIERLNAAANDETRISLEQKLAFQRKLTEEQNLYNQYAADQITIDVLRTKLTGVRLDYEKELAAIQNRAANFKGGGAAAQSQALQLQQQLIREELKRADIRLKYLRLVAGEEAALKAQQSILFERLQQETQALELQRQQALERSKVAGDEELINQLYNSKLKTLNEQLSLLNEQNAARLRAIELERQLAVPQAVGALEDRSRQAGQDLEEARIRARGGAGEKALDEAREILQIQERLAALNGQASLDEAIAEKNRLKALEDARAFEEVMINLTNQVGVALKNAMETALVDTIGAALTGADDLNDKLKQTAATLLSTIGKALVGAGIQGLAGNDGQGFFSILSGNFGRADGGPVNSNQAYVVGEREPELFVPSSSGTIYNQEQMRSAMSTYSYGSESRTFAEPMSINVETTSINGMEFITPEQFKKGTEDAAARGAKMGEQRAINRLRQSRSTRSKLGI